MASADLIPAYYPVERQEGIKVIALGFMLGLAIPLLGWMISTWIIEPVFCKADSAFVFCATGGLWGYHIAAVLLSAAAVAILAGWTVYRPLIISLASLMSLWGLQFYLAPIFTLSGAEYYITSAILFAGTYFLFYWLMRLRNFAFSIALAVIALIVVRWVLIV